VAEFKLQELIDIGANIVVVNNELFKTNSLLFMRLVIELF
jgi:hypothetical protein